MATSYLQREVGKKLDLAFPRILRILNDKTDWFYFTESGTGAIIMIIWLLQLRRVLMAWLLRRQMRRYEKLHERAVKG